MTVIGVNRILDVTAVGTTFDATASYRAFESRATANEIVGGFQSGTLTMYALTVIFATAYALAVFYTFLAVATAYVVTTSTTAFFTNAFTVFAETTAVCVTKHVLTTARQGIDGDQTVYIYADVFDLVDIESGYIQVESTTFGRFAVVEYITQTTIDGAVTCPAFVYGQEYLRSVVVI